MPRSKRSIVEYRIYDLPLDLPVFCLSGDDWRISDVLSNRLHFHNCLEIGFCHTDSGFLGFEDETVPFAAGDIFLIPRHVPHTTCSAPGCKSLWSYLFVDLDALVQPLAPSGSYMMNSTGWLDQYLRITQQSSPRLHFLLGCMLEEARVSSGESAHMLRIYALAVCAELQRLQTSSSRPDAQPRRAFPLKPALEYVHDHYMEPCSTETLSSLCHLSQTHFRRLFLSCMGETPLQFVTSARIYQACVLLITTNEPILDVAAAVGMPSISSFNRNFQQIMGMSPRQYRTGAAHRAPSGSRRDQVVPFKGWTLPEK